MTSTISLKEYRVLYPGTDTEPSLTQMGAIGFLMERSRQRRLRQMQRREARRRFVSTMVSPFIRLGEKLRSTWARPLSANTPLIPNTTMHHA